MMWELQAGGYILNAVLQWISERCGLGTGVRLEENEGGIRHAS